MLVSLNLTSQCTRGMCNIYMSSRFEKKQSTEIFSYKDKKRIDWANFKQKEVKPVAWQAEVALKQAPY